AAAKPSTAAPVAADDVDEDIDDSNEGGGSDVGDDKENAVRGRRNPANSAFAGRSGISSSKGIAPLKRPLLPPPPPPPSSSSQASQAPSLSIVGASSSSSSLPSSSSSFSSSSQQQQEHEPLPTTPKGRRAARAAAADRASHRSAATPEIPLPRGRREFAREDDADEDDDGDGDGGSMAAVPVTPTARRRPPPPAVEAATTPATMFDASLIVTPAAAKTSNNTLSALPVLRMDEFSAALARTAKTHVKEKALIESLLIEDFDQWDVELSLGFNLLLYGVGSKISVLTEFKKRFCRSAPVLTLHGYAATANVAKDVIGKICTDIVAAEGGGGSGSSTTTTTTTATKTLGTLSDQLHAISQYFARPGRRHGHLYLIVHNIDGAALRGGKPQQLLASLVSSCPRGTVRLLASIDHVNAPLMWDRATADRYRWVWKACNTFAGYAREAVECGGAGGGAGGLITVDAGARVAVTGAVHVLKSLNRNARRVFRILAEAQV
ncbi:origin recognition complex subunit 2-domain-containing protein, partial [Zopfochytrium polystomum]